jgi:putative ABC transport system permease protein
MFSGVLRGIDVISIVILVIMTLVLGNTIAMGARERTHEYGVLRTIGFLPWHIVLVVAGESIAIGVLGGALGFFFAWPFIDLFMSRVVEETLGAVFPYFRLESGVAAIGMTLAAVLSALAAAIPAWRASRLRVVDAVRRA